MRLLSLRYIRTEPRYCTKVFSRTLDVAMLLLASIVATTALVPGLQSPHHTARLRSPLGRPAPRSPPLRALGPSFFDKLLYGERGKPSPPPPDELCAEDLCSVRDLRAVFAQWDTDGTGTLQLDELKRAFLAVGVEVDLEEVFSYSLHSTHFSHMSEPILFFPYLTFQFFFSGIRHARFGWRRPSYF